MSRVGWSSLEKRDRRPELMDQPGLDPTDHRQALRALERINRISQTAHRYWPEIACLAARFPATPLRLLDVGCGGGDVAIALARLAKRRGVELEVRGCDLSPEALDHARENARRGHTQVGFFEMDVTRDQMPESDVIVCSLFLHHLEDNLAVDLLRRLSKTTRHLMQVSDLVRSPLGRAYAWVGSRLLTRSPVVRVDALLSVAAAYTPAEAADLAARAGMGNAEIRTVFPARFLLTWKRT